MTDSPPPLIRTGGDAGATTMTARTRVATSRRGALVRLVVAAVEWSRAARAGREVVVDQLTQTVTPAGWLVIAFATVGLALGWSFGWVEWLVAGLASLVLVVFSAPFLFGTRGYGVTVRLAHERVVAGERIEGVIDIRNVGRRTALPGRVDLPVGNGLVELGVPLLRAGHGVTRPLSIPATRRGVILVGPPTAVRTDPIGLLRREHQWDEVRELFVHPRTVAVPPTSSGLVRDLEGNASKRLVDADISFHAIREYTPGDSRRQIHWKSTAKTGRLMVRQFEESLRSRLAVVLSVAEAEYASDDEFELAVGVAASVAAQGVRDGRDLAVVTGAEIPRVVRGRMRSIAMLTGTTPRGLLDEFSRVESLEHTMPLEEVCRLTVEASESLSLAFVVCGAQVTTTRLRRAALAFSAQTTVIAIVCDQKAHPRRRGVGDLVILTVGVMEDLSALLLRGAQA